MEDVERGEMDLLAWGYDQRDLYSTVIVKMKD